MDDGDQVNCARLGKGGYSVPSIVEPEYIQIRRCTADFVLPEYRLIIDPFSPFHHSQDEAVQRDIVKVASYTTVGYAYYHPWALGGNRWSWDQYHDSRKKIQVGQTRIRLYAGVNADENSYRNLSRNLSGQAMSTSQMLQSIPELMQGPRYKLTDPRDIKAKQSPGYRIGENLGAGANSVGAANSRRRTTPIMSLSAGQRRLRRRR